LGTETKSSGQFTNSNENIIVLLNLFVNWFRISYRSFQNLGQVSRNGIIGITRIKKEISLSLFPGLIPSNHVIMIRNCLLGDGIHRDGNTICLRLERSWRDQSDWPVIERKRHHRIPFQAPTQIPDGSFPNQLNVNYPILDRKLSAESSSPFQPFHGEIHLLDELINI
jgi:hypothetical protein